jgi:hypothetical protein
MTGGDNTASGANALGSNPTGRGKYCQRLPGAQGQSNRQLEHHQRPGCAARESERTSFPFEHVPQSLVTLYRLLVAGSGQLYFFADVEKQFIQRSCEILR